MDFATYTPPEKSYSNENEIEWFKIKNDTDYKLFMLGEFEAAYKIYVPSQKRKSFCFKSPGFTAKFNDEDELVRPSLRFFTYLADVTDDKAPRLVLAELPTTVIEAIAAYKEDQDGFGFDKFPEWMFKLKRTGTGLDTKYQITPMAHVKKSVPEEIMLQYVAAKDIKSIVNDMFDNSALELESVGASVVPYVAPAKTEK